MIGQQDQAAADQIGASVVETPQRGELLMHRLPRRRIADAGDQLVEDRPAGTDDPGWGQIERGQIFRRQGGEANLAALDQAEWWVSPHPNPSPLAGEGVTGGRFDNAPLLGGEIF